MIVFPTRDLGVCLALGKRHPNQERTLQLTRLNDRAIITEPAKFAALGVRVCRDPQWSLEASVD